MNGFPVIRLSAARPSLKASAASTWAALAVNSLVGFLLTPFILASLGHAGYGLWSLIGTFTGYYGLLNLGLGPAVTHYVARRAGSGDWPGASRIASTAAVFFGCTGLAVALLSFLLAPTLAAFFGLPAEQVPAFVRVVRILGTATGVTFLSGVFTATLAALEWFVVSNGIGVAGNLARAALTVAALHGGLGLEGAAWSALAGACLTLAASALAVHRFRPGLPIALRLASPDAFRLLLAYGLVTAVIAVSDLLRSDLDAVVVAKCVGLTAVAGYAVASSLVRLMVGMTTAGLAVLMPRFSSLEGAAGGRAEAQRLFLRALVLASMAAFGFAAMLGGFADPLLRLWVGPRFPEAPAILLTLAAATALAVAQSPGISLLYGQRRHHLYAAATLAEGLLNLALSLAFARRYGAWGVALGTLVSMLASKGIAMPLYVSRAAGVPLARYARPLAACAGAAAVAATLARLAVATVPLAPLPLLIAVAPPVLLLYAALALAGLAPEDRLFLFSQLTPLRAHGRRLWLLAQAALSRLPAGGGRRILFYCPSTVMAEHLAPYWDLLKGDPRLDCRVFFDFPPTRHSSAEEARMRALLPPRVCQGKKAAYLFFPHLVITADHPFTVRFPRILFTGHGGQGKQLPDEAQPYAYGRHAYDGNRLRYAAMMEESEALRTLAETGRPDLHGVIRVIGNLSHDRLLEESRLREAHRARLGIRPGELVVTVLTTWGPAGLLNVLGESFLAEADRLSSRYRFLFVLHPNEFRQDMGGEPGWGARLRQRSPSCLQLRDPAESWIPYLSAADLVVSDHTSLIQSALLLLKPVITIPVPSALLMPGSLTEQLFKIAPSLRMATDLERALAGALSGYPEDGLRQLAARLHPLPGQAASRARGVVYDLLRSPHPA